MPVSLFHGRGEDDNKQQLPDTRCGALTLFGPSIPVSGFVDGDKEVLERHVPMSLPLSLDNDKLLERACLSTDDNRLGFTRRHLNARRSFKDFSTEASGIPPLISPCSAPPDLSVLVRGVPGEVDLRGSWKKCRLTPPPILISAAAFSFMEMSGNSL